MFVLKRLDWFFKLEYKRYVIGMVALILVSIFNLVPPMAMGHIIDAIDAKTLTPISLFQNVAALLGAAFAMYGLRFIWRSYIIGTSNKLGRLLRAQLFKHFTAMSPSFYQKYRTGDLMAHATNDVRVVTMLAGPGVMSAVDASVTAIVTLATMFFALSWQLTLVAILPLPLMVYLTSRVNRRSYHSVMQSQEAFSDLNNKVQESIAGTKVIKSFGFQKDEMADFQAVNEMTYRKNMTMIKYQSLYSPVTGICIGASYAITLLVGGYLITQQEFTLGNLITFITYLDMLVWPMNAIGFLVNMGQRGRVSYERIAKLLDETSDVADTATTPADFFCDRLVFDIDRFAYEDLTTVENIHFQIAAGQTLGLVGPTGGGKTTLLKLLLREHDLSQGSIQLGHYNIKDLALKDLRNLVGYVPQDQMLFATSIRENIRFGKPTTGEQAVIAAAELSCVAEDIAQMPEQYDTIIGERGVSLSGGQKQRIAMARAFVKNPEILILDDSLSAVDAKTEHTIVDNLKLNRQGKTTLITAHRLSAVNHADLIIVVDKGTILERGNHEQLMAQGGWYAQTYQAQQLEAQAHALEKEDAHV